MDAVIWSRIQFAMTAAYHWLFVPLTLGLALVMAVMAHTGGDPVKAQGEEGHLEAKERKPVLLTP